MVQAAGKMLAHVKRLDGKTTTIDIEAADSVLLVKEKIQAESGIPPECQRLIVDGKELQDQCTMQDPPMHCGKEQTIHLVLRLRDSE